jgi:HK97 gp10 family phage protein
MAMRTELAGFKECREGLAEFSKTIQRNIAKRALRPAAEVVADATRARAAVSNSPYNKTPGSLRAAVTVVPARGKGAVKVAVLVADPAAVPNEYGTTKMAAQPFFRPAVSASEGTALAVFGAALKGEVEAAADKAARKSKAAGS